MFTNLRRQHSQTVVLDVQLAQARQLANFAWQIEQIVITQSQLEVKSVISLSYTRSKLIISLRFADFSDCPALSGCTQSRCRPSTGHAEFLQTKQKGEFYKGSVVRVRIAFLTNHEKIARQNRLVQIVVRQVEHLERRKRTKATRQRAQPIDGHIENAQLGHRRQGDGQLFDVIVGHVQDLQVDQIGNAGRNAGQLVVAERYASDVDHVYWRHQIARMQLCFRINFEM